MDDPALLWALRKGDRTALEELYRRHAPLVWRFALGLARDERLAEDALQEAFLVLMKEPSRFDPARAALSTWLCAVARNRVRKMMAREARYADDEPLEPESDPRGDYERGEMMILLREAVEQLPADFREVVLLCAYEEMTYEEAGLALGIPVGTVRSRLARAKALLARAMNHERA